MLTNESAKYFVRDCYFRNYESSDAQVRTLWINILVNDHLRITSVILPHVLFIESLRSIVDFHSVLIIVDSIKMDGAELYDEFGNYIGPELESEHSDSEEDYEQDQQNVGAGDVIEFGGQVEDDDEDDQEEEMQVVLHEDKKYYPSALEVYGPGVETIVQEEDAQLLSEPIVAPVKDKKFSYYQKELPRTTYDLE